MKTCKCAENMKAAILEAATEVDWSGPGALDGCDTLEDAFDRGVGRVRERIRAVDPPRCSGCLPRVAVAPSKADEAIAEVVRAFTEGRVALTPEQVRLLRETFDGILKARSTRPERLPKVDLDSLWSPK